MARAYQNRTDIANKFDSIQTRGEGTSYAWKTAFQLRSQFIPRVWILQRNSKRCAASRIGSG